MPNRQCNRGLKTAMSGNKKEKVLERVVPLGQLGIHDVPRVGGKNASLGEMIANLGQLGVSVPSGFASTAEAFREFLAEGQLKKKIKQTLDPGNILNRGIGMFEEEQP